jgi:DNA invertase Pin-like site-specific DNA recombinase
LHNVWESGKSSVRGRRSVVRLDREIAGTGHSVTSRRRPYRLATIIEFLRPGDELVVTRLDRLGRDTRDVLNIVHECDQRQAFVTVLDPHICTRGEAGRIVMTVLGMVAQMERRFIKERQREGIERAKGEGVYRGGKRRVDRAAADAAADGA